MVISGDDLPRRLSCDRVGSVHHVDQWVIITFLYLISNVNSGRFCWLQGGGEFISNIIQDSVQDTFAVKGNITGISDYKGICNVVPNLGESVTGLGDGQVRLCQEVAKVYIFLAWSGNIKSHIPSPACLP